MRPWFLFPLTAALVLVSSSAWATPNFPSALEGDLSLPAAPDCSLCHTDGDQGGTGTVNTPFGKNMRARGLVAYDTSSLSAALGLMESENVTSAGGCLSDVDELKAGRSPDDPGDQADCDGGGSTTTTTSTLELPTYGCSVVPGSASGPSRWGAGRAWVFMLTALGMVLVSRRIGRAPRAVLGLFLLVSASGCTHVQAYQRGMLAHPTMTTSDVDGVGVQHMYSVMEGPTGGGAAAEGGCGCN